MKLSIWANEERGRAAWLAGALGVQPPTVSDWCTEKKPVPEKRCVEIEHATHGAVTRKDLRPDDWQQIWPELATQDPPQPATDAHAAGGAIKPVTEAGF